MNLTVFTPDDKPLRPVRVAPNQPGSLGEQFLAITESLNCGAEFDLPAVAFWDHAREVAAKYCRSESARALPGEPGGCGE